MTANNTLEAQRIMKPETTVVWAFQANDAINSWFDHFGPCGDNYRDDGVEAWLVDHIQDCHLHRLQENWSDDLMVMPSREEAQQLLKGMIVDALAACHTTTLEKL